MCEIFEPQEWGFQSLCKFCKHIQNENGLSIVSTRSDQGEKIENENFQAFCEN